MNTLESYYLDLQRWEGLEPIGLVTSWPEDVVEVVKTEWSEAVKAARLDAVPCPIRPQSSNQSIGNQVGDFLIERLSPHWKKLQVQPCPGPGYPDRQIKIESLLVALELKATSDWNPTDSNRRVLTSSSDKLRRRFLAPIHHLLCTASYRFEGQTAFIGNVRLDFLQPSTQVNVRLEASVSHKLLSQSPHPYADFSI